MTTLGLIIIVFIVSIVIVLFLVIYYFLLLPKICPENSYRDYKGFKTNVPGCTCNSGYYWFEGQCKM